VTLPSGSQFELEHDDQRAVVVEVGGGLRTYSVGGLELLDGYGAEEICSSGRGQVLIPWPNRLEDGRYEFEGERHQLALDEPERRNAIHGLVRWSAWNRAEQEPNRVVMEHLVHPRPGYPFSLALSIEYVLSDNGLSVRTTTANAGETPCPYGAGAHPYLTVGTTTVDSAMLQAPGRMALRCDERAIPVGKDSIEGTEYDFRRPRLIGATKLDHAFTDLDRDDDGLARVELRDPNARTALTVWVDQSYPYIQLFTGDSLPDVARRSIAIEPMTCAPNAFRSGDGLIVLEPGASITSVWGIVPAQGIKAHPASPPSE
jgi:aldose 1-epimerase